MCVAGLCFQRIVLNWKLFKVLWIAYEDSLFGELCHKQVDTWRNLFSYPLPSCRNYYFLSYMNFLIQILFVFSRIFYRIRIIDDSISSIEDSNLLNCKVLEIKIASLFRRQWFLGLEFFCINKFQVVFCLWLWFKIELKYVPYVCLP